MKDYTNQFEGVAQKKSYAFALEIVKSALEIQKERKEFIISKQLLRSGTSIGANLQEARGRQSDKDLLTKLHISYKEAKECRYWLFLLSDIQFIDERNSKKLIGMIEELLRIIGKSILTLRKKLNYTP